MVGSPVKGRRDLTWNGRGRAGKTQFSVERTEKVKLAGYVGILQEGYEGKRTVHGNECFEPKELENESCHFLKWGNQGGTFGRGDQGREFGS